MKNEENTYFLAWTTTPWTLPSNLALSVNPGLEYVKVKDLKKGCFYILAKCRLGEIYKSAKNLFTANKGVVEEKAIDRKKDKKKPAGKE